MTPIRQGAVIKTVKDITIGTALSLLLINGTASMQGCRSNRDESEEQEQTDVKPPVRPVKTYISEMKPGEFKITDEVPVSDVSQAAAIIRYIDGKRDTLNPEAAKRLVMTDSTTKDYYRNPGGYQHHNHSSLGNVLLWGGMGYMLGRNNSSSRFYNEANERRYSSSAYANPAVYGRSAQLHNEYHGYRRSVAARPSGSRGGFFRGGSRSVGG